MKKKKALNKTSNRWAVFQHAAFRRESLWQLFAIVLCPLQIWAAIIVFQDVPALILRLPMWDLIGVVIYIEAFMLLEAIGIWLFLLILAIVLPAGLFRDKFVAQGTMIVMVSSIWAILLQLHFDWFLQLNGPFQMAWVMTYLVSLILFSYYVWQNKRLESIVLGLVNRIEPLAVLYLFFGVLSLIAVVVQNLV